MEKKFILSSTLIIVFLLTLNVANATTNTCALNVTLVNQDPYPAVPGEYVNVVFQVTGVSNSDCGGAKLNLLLGYPFSLDEQDSLQLLGGSTWQALVDADNSAWTVPYKIRVDKDALDGNTQIQVQYSGLSQGGFSTKKMNIAVEDVRTNFDAVLQDVSGSEVSIAIANTGKNVANSIIVRVPKQENFIVTGSDGQMVGNLESGDYSIVSFSISPTYQRNVNMSRQQNQSNALKFDVYYTDSIGERRTVNLELPVPMSMYGANSTSFTGRNYPVKSSWSIWYTMGIAAAVIIIGIGAYIKIKRDRARAIKKKNTPDWMKSKDKGRE